MGEPLPIPGYCPKGGVVMEDMWMFTKFLILQRELRPQLGGLVGSMRIEHVTKDEDGL